MPLSEWPATKYSPITDYGRIRPELHKMKITWFKILSPSSPTHWIPRLDWRVEYEYDGWTGLLNSSILAMDSSHLCFSSVHIVGSLTSKLPSILHVSVCNYVWEYKCMYVWMYVCMHAWMDGCMHVRTYVRMYDEYGWTDGWMEGYMHACMPATLQFQ